jgi:hypothetical protein
MRVWIIKSKKDGYLAGPRDYNIIVADNKGQYVYLYEYTFNEKDAEMGNYRYILAEQTGVWAYDVPNKKG